MDDIDDILDKLEEEEEKRQSPEATTDKLPRLTQDQMFISPQATTEKHHSEVNGNVHYKGDSSDLLQQPAMASFQPDDNIAAHTKATYTSSLTGDFLPSEIVGDSMLLSDVPSDSITSVIQGAPDSGNESRESTVMHNDQLSAQARTERSDLTVLNTLNFVQSDTSVVDDFTPEISASDGTAVGDNVPDDVLLPSQPAESPTPQRTAQSPGPVITAIFEQGHVVSSALPSFISPESTEHISGRLLTDQSIITSPVETLPASVDSGISDLSDSALPAPLPNELTRFPDEMLFDPAGRSSLTPDSEPDTSREDSVVSTAGDLPADPHTEPASINQHSVPVAIPGRKIIGFQPSSWGNIDDVSDSELEEFLKAFGETEGTSLSEELQLVPADNYAAATSEPIHDNGHSDESEANPLPWTSDDLAELRASPPLELAPPIPMTLVDVTDLMDQELLITPSTAPSTSVVRACSLAGESGDSNATSDAGSGEDSEHTSTSDEILIQLSTDGSSSQDSESCPSDYIIGAENAVASDLTDAEDTFRSASSSFTTDENTSPSHPVIFSVDNLGKVKPEWVPDDFAPICMLCGGRFSLVKRRHHCRACGSVICASCGNYRAKLEYLDMKEDRVCALCNETFQYRINGADQSERTREGHSGDSMRSPSPVVVSLFNGPQPPGVLRRQDDPRRERRNVVFFDGIRPGGDLQEPEAHGDGRRLAIMNAKRQRRSPGAPAEAPPPPKSRSVPKKSSAHHVVRLFVNRDILPVMQMTKDGHYVLNETPDLPSLLDKFAVCPSEPVDFYVNLCLRVTVQLVDLKCCMNEIVWCFSTSGMRLVGQDELIILLVRHDNEALPPRDLFLHLNEIFLHAKQGHVIGNLGHSIVSLSGFELGFLGNRNNAGFLFIRQSYQCTNSLKLPEPPYLFGILMTKWEIPWAKLFPLRLMLRLGIEYRYYPCPLISFRSRRSVFEEVGHTVMNLLCDFRNFQYHLPCVEDTECCMEKGMITIRIPRHRYDQIVKLCQASNEHVLAIGLGFTRRADAHLVCVQNFENGQYETQAINIESKGRKVTGTSFIIFNASLKGTEPSECRVAVVEDGVMAQINLRGLEELKLAFKAMRNMTFKAVRKMEDGSGPVEQEMILVEWTTDGKTCNSGVRSPIDSKDMTGIESRRVALKHSMDFLNGTLAVRCTEVFLTDEKETGMVYREEIDVSRLAENLAMASCSVLRTHLYDYRDAGTTKIAVRVSLGPDTVEYEVGAKNERFSPQALTEFDDKIMPLIYECARVWGARPRLEMELIFRIFQL